MTRRSDGTCTTRNPAARNALSAPTCISPHVTSLPGAGFIGYASTAEAPFSRARSTVPSASARLTPWCRQPAPVERAAHPIPPHHLVPQHLPGPGHVVRMLGVPAQPVTLALAPRGLALV